MINTVKILSNITLYNPAIVTVFVLCQLHLSAQTIQSIKRPVVLLPCIIRLYKFRLQLRQQYIVTHTVLHNFVFERAGFYYPLFRFVNFKLIVWRNLIRFGFQPVLQLVYSVQCGYLKPQTTLVRRIITSNFTICFVQISKIAYCFKISIIFDRDILLLCIYPSYFQEGKDACSFDCRTLISVFLLLYFVFCTRTDARQNHCYTSCS